MKNLKLILTLALAAVLSLGTLSGCNKTPSGDDMPEVKTVTVTFDSAGGSEVAAVKINKGEKISATDAPVKAGCVFIGWELNGATFDFSSTPINEDITLTAKWEAQTFTVTFIDYDGWIYKTETVKWGENATAPANPIRNGYTFIGWDKNYTGVKSDLTVTAQYKKNAGTVDPTDPVDPVDPSEPDDPVTYAITLNGYNTQQATDGFGANEGAFLYKSRVEIAASLYWHKSASKKSGGAYVVTAIAKTGEKTPADYDYLILSYQNETSGKYAALLNLSMSAGYIAEFSENIENLAKGSINIGVNFKKNETSSFDFSTLLSYVSDEVTSNTIDSLPSSYEGVALTWSSSDAGLYTVHEGMGYTNRINQTHKKQSVTVTLNAGGKNYSKTVTINPVLFKQLVNPKAAYFSISSTYSYMANSERYKSSNQLFSDAFKSKMDMCYYSFAIPSDASGNVTLDTKYLSRVMELHSYGIRVLLVIDGANAAPLKAMTVACNSDATRKTFVDNIMNLVKTNNFDGVDIDWEFPGLSGLDGYTTAVDQINLNKLLRDLREKMDEYQDADGSGYILSVAVPPSFPASRYKFTGDESLGGINDYVDYVNMMSYDLNNGSYASHLSACYSSAMSGDFKFGCVKGVQTFIDLGLDKSKIILGAAGYGKAYKITGAATETGLNSAATLTKIDGITGSYASGTIYYVGIKQCLDSGKYKKYEERDVGGNLVGSYLYNAADGIFITYDSAEAVKAKCDFAKANGIGVMLWAYGEDATDTVVNAICANL